MFATMQTFAQTYTYDNLNRLTKVVYGNGTTITYTYDALGNRISKKVVQGSGNSIDKVDIKSDQKEIWYDLNGRKLISKQQRKGVYIVTMSDGTTKKVVIK